MLTLTYAEMDVPRCTLTYGVAPCSAQLGVTGERKCFNTPATCQVPEDYSGTTQTLRWVINSEHVPHQKVDAIPSLLDVDVSPQRLEVGESLGKRERAKSRFKNHPHNDIGLDPYVYERDYTPWERGTFWGKFHARWPNISGFPYRLRRGDYDPASTDAVLSQLRTSHYVADKLELGSDTATINALDVLTFVEGNKALCPPPSNGLLNTAITEASTGFTLAPVGIGATYPSSGYASMGKEYVSFTRAGDVISFTGRGLRGSQQKAHDAGETFQVGALLRGNISAILNQLLQYTDTPAPWYDLPTWEAEAQANASEILEAHIATPTEVSKLLGHLMQEMCLDIHSDIRRQKIVMRVLRQLTPSFELTEDNSVGLAPALDNSSRISAVYMQYARINPLEKFDEDQNYNGHLLRIDDDPQAALSGNAPAIRKIQAIYIPGTLRQSASDTAQLVLGRYARVLRSASAVVPVGFAPALGDIGNVTAKFFEDATGGTAPVPMQVIQLVEGVEQNRLELLEYGANYVRPTDGARTVTISAELGKNFNINLRQMHDESHGPFIPDNTRIIFDCPPEVLIGSKLATYAIIAGEWPEIANGVTIELSGFKVFGFGGLGGRSLVNPAGGDGGNALYTRVPLTIRDSEIGAGGGGGGGAIEQRTSGPKFYTGAGGAGHPAGAGVPGGKTYTGGRNTSAGGDGGDLGEPGTSGGGGPTQGYPGGEPGIAIDGKSFITLINCTVYGAEVN